MARGWKREAQVSHLVGSHESSAIPCTSCSRQDGAYTCSRERFYAVLLCAPGTPARLVGYANDALA